MIIKNVKTDSITAICFLYIFFYSSSSFKFRLVFTSLTNFEKATFTFLTIDSNKEIVFSNVDSFFTVNDFSSILSTMSGMSLTIELTRTEPADTAFFSTVLTASFTDAPVISSKETAFFTSGVSDFITDLETTFSFFSFKLICVIIVSFGIACLFKFYKSTVLYKSKEFELTTAGSNISSFSSIVAVGSVCSAASKLTSLLVSAIVLKDKISWLSSIGRM